MTLTRLDLAGLTAHVLGPTDAATTCVLFHGFGAPGDDLVAIAELLEGAPVRFVCPEAPLELGGLYGDSRAWWMIDLALREVEQARGGSIDRRGNVPNGLVEARTQVLALLDELEPIGTLVLGGFSQGAMIALDVALQRPKPPAGLVLMSGTLIAESVWQPRLASLAGVPVMLSHGRGDGLLPFDMAEVLRDKLTAAGAIVDWTPFTGGHEIPPIVIAGLVRLLDRVAG